MDRYIRHCSSRRPPHICTHGAPPPPYNADVAQEFLAILFVLYLFRYCCFFCLLNILAHPFTPFALSTCLQRCLILFYLFIFTKGIATITLRHTALPCNTTTMIVCLLGRIPLYFSTFLRTACLQLISVLPFEHEYSCILSYILPYTAIYSGIKGQSEAVRVDGRREAVYAARCFSDGLPSSVKIPYIYDEDWWDKYPL